ncbi:cyclic lactone autoinducer peptide [Serpentinicella alkaliphila]|uniref:Cyclic lactone autoinducer peptide n=1 Tax=Serpentinicella alkaliphila TaxID=1734049 RepID=A0A4R2UH68_9FIRM|nr:cyclic lactone autoinducer peptide [Serpentinicella alkaliphila]QUH25290.1 cyclic lactone autoinducer peptide [Serpentinicella alkaliphila]TCQ07103.1 cyclic lactone autoinducer peptide [Serpentinicella alkaliphila]
MKKKLVSLFVTLLTFLALTNVAAASTITFYQPELPNKFKK